MASQAPSTLADPEETADVLYQALGPVALLTLNRPRYRNAQSWGLLDALDRQLDRAIEDQAIRVVVVRGAGEHFSSGHDLGTPEQKAEVEARRLVEWQGLDWYEAFRKRRTKDLAARWYEHGLLKNRGVLVAQGDEGCRGVLKGIEPDGRFRVVLGGRKTVKVAQSAAILLAP